MRRKSFKATFEKKIDAMRPAKAPALGSSRLENQRWDAFETTAHQYRAALAKSQPVVRRVDAEAQTDTALLCNTTDRDATTIQNFRVRLELLSNSYSFFVACVQAQLTTLTLERDAARQEWKPSPDCHTSFCALEVPLSELALLFCRQRGKLRSK